MTVQEILAESVLSCQRLADALRKAPAAAIERRVNWHGMEIPLGVLVFRVLFHAGYHTGQIADVRRALGLKSVLQ